MSSNTEKLNLLKVDPVADGEQYFNVDTMLNANWDKVDAFADQIGDKVDGDLLPRLNTAQTSEITFKPGTQMITADRDKPFNLSSLTGRMLLNLLGRSGTFDSVQGWNFVSMSGAITTTNPLYGGNALLATLTASFGRVSRIIPTTVGRYYIAIVDARMGTATSANIDVTNIGSGTFATSATAYQTSFIRFTATATSHTVGCTVVGANGQTAYIDGLRVYEISQTEYNAIPGLNAADVATLYPYTEGLAGVKNPYMIRWTNANKTDVAAMLAFETELLAPPVLTNNADRETLSQGSDGQYYKVSQFRKIQLTGALNWEMSANLTGFKEFKIVGFTNYSPSGAYPVKYDGSIMANALSNRVDVASFDSKGNFYLTAGVNDTGWGDNYTPTADEIKAYFYGWKLFDASLNGGDGTAPYNNSGAANKQWTPLESYNGSRYFGVVTTLPTNTVANTIPINNYAKNREVSPYELMYRRAASINEPVASEGAMSLVAGDNVIEVGSGLIIRESIVPKYSNAFKSYHINFRFTGNDNDSPLRYMADRILQVYRNGRVDPTWSHYRTNTEYGNDRVACEERDYDKYGIYSTSYITLDKYPVVPITGSTPNNERAILDDTIRDIQQLTRRVSVTELRKVEKEATYPWLPLTLLNGAMPYTVASDYRQGLYVRKKENMLELSGLVQNVPNGVIIARLPVEFRPLFSSTMILAYENSPSTSYSFRIKISLDGGISILFASGVTSPWVSVACTVPLD